jgi:glutaredoxin 3
LGLLRSKGAAIAEVEAGMNPSLKAEMIQRAGGRRTFPQIFIGDTHVGGCDDLYALEARGGLDPLLQGG